LHISTDESGYRGNARVDDIQQIVARYYDMPKADLLSRRRQRAISGPRQIAMYLCRELTARSLPDIGRRFGKDHTTVLHAIRAVEARWQAVAGDIAALREQIIHFAELRELDALSGRVYLAAEAQYEWPDTALPEPVRVTESRRTNRRKAFPPVPPEAWIPGHPIPSAFPDRAP
jgi:hypothetical protein